jgi:hypothetical protein
MRGILQTGSLLAIQFGMIFPGLFGLVPFVPWLSVMSLCELVFNEFNALG